MDLFGTAGIRGDARERVTPELALAVGRAAGADGAEFVLGRDGRRTGPALSASVEAGLESAGARVVILGQVPTPALAYASRDRHGVMVTASHNPPTDNGLKLFVDGQEYDSSAERRIETRVADDPRPAPWDEWGDTEHEDVLAAYRRAIVEFASDHGAPLDGLRIAVDCGTGMAALATPHVLREMGAQVVALNAQVDGHFPGRESKPTPKTLRDLCGFVASGEFALGIGHDGDADRVVFVDDEGEIVHEDTVVAVLAEHYTRESDARDPVVVTTPNASDRIDERVEHADGRIERVHLGGLHEGVAAATDGGDDRTEVVFAAEPWKHLHTGFGPWIDGVASAAVFARLVADRGLPALRAPVAERPYRKFSIECPDERKAAVMDALAETLPAQFPDATVDTEYGIRLAFPDNAWTLVRPSGTEPYVRVYAESDDVDDLVGRVADTVRREV